MANLDNIKEKAMQFASKASQVTGDIIEQSRLQIQKTQINHQIRKSYEKFGMLYYSMSKNNSYNEAIIEQCIKEIDVLHKKMEKVTQLIIDSKKETQTEKEQQPAYSVDFAKEEQEIINDMVDSVKEEDVKDITEE